MSARKMRIMVVDDEASFTRLVQLNLEQTGVYEVQTENVPTMAVATAERFHPDLILLDVMMPGLDGGELAAQLRERSKLKNVPIVFLTAAVRKEEVSSHGGLIGGLPFLAKPVDMAELVECLKQHLGK
jgi:DNA-binding response OmpR family regulator